VHTQDNNANSILLVGDDEEIDLDELDEMQRFLAELGISVTDTKTAIRATLILRQFEGSGVPKEDLRKTLSFSETQSIDLDSLQVRLAHVNANVSRRIFN
jgi:hypothetical protein